MPVHFCTPVSSPLILVIMSENFQVTLCPKSSLINYELISSISVTSSVKGEILKGILDFS